MANHTIDCGTCGGDLRADGHEPNCPGENASLEKKEIFDRLYEMRQRVRSNESEAWDLNRNVEDLKSELRRA